jgi:hypothetical protein
MAGKPPAEGYSKVLSLQLRTLNFLGENTVEDFSFLDLLFSSHFAEDTEKLSPE